LYCHQGEAGEGFGSGRGHRLRQYSAEAADEAAGSRYVTGEWEVGIAERDRRRCGGGKVHFQPEQRLQSASQNAI